MDKPPPRGKDRVAIEVAETEAVSSDSPAGEPPAPSAAPTDRPVGASEAGDWTLDGLARGTNVGRFVVLSTLGRGGMGLVLAAYDPVLDRRVALKLLRPRSFGEHHAARARERLLREAKSMAKLSHPNVVAVHDVGTYERRVFVAMEYVDGLTLRQWCTSEERSWRDLLEVFTKAGRGLAAAHAAGLVHRDFKPENVLVGRDGRVRVTDFGLVSTSGQIVDEDFSVQGGGEVSKIDPALPLTCPGTILGTPLYMAPEQHENRTVDARADQFAFCVALYEALYGMRPFEAKSYPELAHSVIMGKVREPPADHTVPAWVHAVVSRGLRSRPSARYDTMDDLLAALGNDPAATRQRRIRVAAVIAGFALLAGLSVYGLLRKVDAREALCTSATAELEKVWSDASRARVLEAFRGTGRPYAADTFERVAAELDDYGAAWAAMRTEACEATHVKGTQSSDMLDARMLCLDHRLSALAALVDLFAERSDTEVLDKAVSASRKLRTLDRCADLDALSAAFPPPEDPEVRARVESLRSRLAEATARRNAGKYEEGRVIAAEVTAQAEELAYAPLRAEAKQILGDLLDLAGDYAAAEATLRQAMQAAAVAKDDESVAQCLARLVHTVGSRLARPDEALAMREFAEMALARAGASDSLRADWLGSLAKVLQTKGRFDEARALQERAIGLTEASHGAASPEVAYALNSLGISLFGQGHYREARTQYQRALAILEKRLGPEHPTVGTLQNNLGNLSAMLGELEAAGEHFERALAVLEATLGSEHPSVLKVLSNTAMVYYLTGRPEAALPHLERVISLREKILGAEHPDVAAARDNLGQVLLDLGRVDEAARETEAAVEIREKVLGADHPEVATSLSNLGSVLLQQGKPEEAYARHARALAIFEKAHGRDHPDAIHALNGMGRAMIALGQRRKAIQHLERAVAVGTTHAGDPELLAGARFSLARALWEEGSDRGRAIRVAEQARDYYASEGDRKAKPLREVTDWLGERTSE